MPVVEFGKAFPNMPMRGCDYLTVGARRGFDRAMRRHASISPSLVMATMQLGIAPLGAGLARLYAAVMACISCMLGARESFMRAVIAGTP